MRFVRYGFVNFVVRFVFVRIMQLISVEKAGVGVCVGGDWRRAMTRSMTMGWWMLMTMLIL